MPFTVTKSTQDFKTFMTANIHPYIARKNLQQVSSCEIMVTNNITAPD